MKKLFSFSRSYLLPQPDIWSPLSSPGYLPEAPEMSEILHPYKKLCFHAWDSRSHAKRPFSKNGDDITHMFNAAENSLEFLFRNVKVSQGDGCYLHFNFIDFNELDERYLWKWAILCVSLLIAWKSTAKLPRPILQSRHSGNNKAAPVLSNLRITITLKSILHFVQTFAIEFAVPW